MPQTYRAQDLRVGYRVEGHFFGRGFRGVIDGVYTVREQNLIEVHVALDASIKVAGKNLEAVCLWLTPSCQMFSADGTSQIGAITTVWA